MQDDAVWRVQRQHQVLLEAHEQRGRVPVFNVLQPTGCGELDKCDVAEGRLATRRPLRADLPWLPGRHYA